MVRRERRGWRRGVSPRGLPGGVAATLAVHEGEMAEGRQFACLLRDDEGRILGLGWWTRTRNPLVGHVRMGRRIMTDPTLRRTGLGLQLMEGMHRLAREDGGVVATLDYRSGTGVGAFYEQCGYVEVGRIPRFIRVAPGDERDSVQLARSLDGQPLTADGRR